jgi:hypothetical protein
MGTATLGFAGGPSVAFRIFRLQQNIIRGMTTHDMTTHEQCAFPDCTKKIKSKRLCGTHYERQRKHGSPEVVLKQGAKPGKTGELSSQWKGNDAGLDAQHKRISSVRGTPRLCSRCGTTDPGKYYHWAFNNTGDRFNIWDYIRLCAGCHRTLDDAFTPRGSKHGCAKLTEADIPKIFEMRRDGKKLREIGKAFKISVTQASDILSGKSWAHLNGGGA